MLDKVTLDVYADVVCPWCYIGEKRLERALAERPELPVERRWRPFQLRPEMPPEGSPWTEFARSKFGGEENARAAFQHVTAVGAEEGIRFDFGRVASAPNTADAHRLILFAADRGRPWEMANALFDAYFARGADLNDAGQLAAVAAEAGLDADEARAFLTGAVKAGEVRDAQAEAARLGIGGVPFYVLDGCYGLSGAQPTGTFLRALDAISEERTASGRA